MISMGTIALCYYSLRAAKQTFTAIVKVCLKKKKKKNSVILAYQEFITSWAPTTGYIIPYRREMLNFVFLIGANKNNIDNDDDDVVKVVVMSINALEEKKKITC